MENDKGKKRPFDSKVFFQKHTAGLVYYSTDKAQKVLIESLEELNMEMPAGGLEYINRLYLNSPPSNITIDREMLEENGVKFIGYSEPIQIDLGPALEKLTHGTMSPTEPVGLPITTESGKVPEVYPVIGSGGEWHDKLSELRNFVKDENILFTIDSIPAEAGGEKMFKDSEITPKHIGGEDSVEEILKSTGVAGIDELTDKILSLPTLDEMLSATEKNGGFRRGELILHVAKPRSLPPKSHYAFESLPLNRELNIVDFHMNQRHDHVWDPILTETDKSAVISEIGLLTIGVECPSYKLDGIMEAPLTTRQSFSHYEEIGKIAVSGLPLSDEDRDKGFSWTVRMERDFDKKKE